MSDSLPPHFSWGIPSYDERDLDALLSGEVTDIPMALRPLADTLTALKGQPTPAELRGEATIMAEFRAQAKFGPAHPGGRAKTLELPTLQPGSRPRRAARHRVRRPANRRFGAFLATAAAAAIVGAVAFTGNLPGPIQRLAHLSTATHHTASSTVRPTPPNLRGRPTSSVRADPHKSVRPSPSPSPSVSASSNASTLCRNFFSYLERRGVGRQWWNSPAYRQLSAEAGGSDHILAFCWPYLKGMFPNGEPTQFPGSFMSSQLGFGNGSQDGNTAPGQNASHPAQRGN
ncbi:MAG TPA: hypothetical protein VF482_21285 [Trebonia sp.]